MESFSLRDALDFQDAPPTTAEELAEAEAAVAELRSDARKEGEEKDNAIEIGDSSSSGSSVDEDVEGTTNSAANAFAASAMKPVATNHTPPAPPVRPPPPPPPPREQKKKSSSNNDNNNVRTPKKRVPVLSGTLTTESNWSEDMNQMVRRSIIKGTWRYNDEARSEANPEHTFELISKETKSSSGEPHTGTYSGYFGLVYMHETPKGKRSSKFKKILEPAVRLEFRNLTKFYRIQGLGKNQLGGNFRINGTAKPVDGSTGTYTVEMRKTYIGGDLVSNSRSRTDESSTSSSLLRSQQQSLMAKPIARPPPPPLPSYASVKSEPFSARVPNTPERQAEKEKFRSPERQDIPTPKQARDGNNNNNTTTPPRPAPQQPSNEAALTQTPTNTGVDRVNGKGMWHAWTRSFDNPLLALLDLFDNAVDASWTLLPEKRYRHQQRQKPKIRVDLDRMGRNGVVLRNASKFIPSLQQVLQVYKSSKTGEEDNSIGENGIGVKHACASLSGLSFVFTKTTDPSDGKCTMSMGILMQELQRDDGIVLPSVAFPLSDADQNGSLDEVQEKLEDHCANFPETWGAAVRAYGDDHFGDGIDRCLHHMDLLRTHRDWRDSDNVFAVVLANLKHAAFNGEEENNEDPENELIMVGGDPGASSMVRRGSNSTQHRSGTNRATYHTVQRGGDSDVDEDAQRSLSLLKTLHDKLPYLYLHLHDLDICVENKAIESIYWERRLAELSKFELQLSQTELWSKIDKKRYSHNNMENSVYTVTHPEETVRFFCGFDPYRCRAQHLSKVDKEGALDDAVMSYVPGGSTSGGITPMGNNSAIKIYLYSRQSGRLIKVQNDPRNEIGLTAGSTDFCQGLTVIVDDYNGTLPLNPTKQDTAYGHSKHGQIHAANLKEWTAAISHFYWNYHYSRFENSKVAVTQAVANARSSLEGVYRNYRNSQSNDETASREIDSQYPTITPLCRGTFINYQRIDFGLTAYHNIPKVRANKVARDSAVPVVNSLEVSRLDEEAGTRAIPSRQQNGEGSSRKKRGRRKNMKYEDDDISRHASDFEVSNNTPKRSRTDMQSQDSLLLGDSAPNNRTSPLEGEHARDSNNLAIENERLMEQMRRYHDHNIQLQESCRRGNHQVMLLQGEVQKRGQEKSAMGREILFLKEENKRLTVYERKQRDKANRWKAEAERLRQQLEKSSSQPPAKEFSSQSSPSSPTKHSGDSDLEKLRNQLRMFKSRAEFYKKENENKKKQIETLMQEKSRFEDRVQELEDAQLSMDSHGGELMQF